MLDDNYDPPRVDLQKPKSEHGDLPRETATGDAPELVKARETIARLNRRCQLAESALNTKVEQFEQRSKGALRSYYFALGDDYAKASKAGKGAFSSSFFPFQRLVAADGCVLELTGHCEHRSPWLRAEQADKLESASDDPTAAPQPASGVVPVGSRTWEIRDTS